MLDTTRCLSYWTQSRHDIPAAVATALEDRIYGCDICQDVCPWNTGPARRSGALPAGDAFVPLADWLHGSAGAVFARYGRLYVPDRDVRYLRRNALVVAGNGDDAARELAAPFVDDPDPMVARAARRAAWRMSPGSER